MCHSNKTPLLEFKCKVSQNVWLYSAFRTFGNGVQSVNALIKKSRPQQNLPNITVCTAPPWECRSVSASSSNKSKPKWNPVPAQTSGVAGAQRQTQRHCPVRAKGFLDILYIYKKKKAQIAEVSESVCRGIWQKMRRYFTSSLFGIILSTLQTSLRSNCL